MPRPPAFRRNGSAPGIGPTQGSEVSSRAVWHPRWETTATGSTRRMTTSCARTSDDETLLPRLVSMCWRIRSGRGLQSINLDFAVEMNSKRTSQRSRNQRSAEFIPLRLRTTPGCGNVFTPPNPRTLKRNEFRAPKSSRGARILTNCVALQRTQRRLSLVRSVRLKNLVGNE
jgi:hypothetical protein